MNSNYRANKHTIIIPDNTFEFYFVGKLEIK